MMRYFFYNLLLVLLAPIVWFYLLLKPKYRMLIQRFSPVVPDFSDQPLWIHACSVGEINAAKGLVASLKKRFPDLLLLVSVSTVSGYELANRLSIDAAVTFAPFDLKQSLHRYIKKANPCGLVIIETEIWPNMIRETSKSGAPVLIINGRISNKQFPRYMRYKTFMPPFYKYLDCVAVQNTVYADRFQQIGVSGAQVEVTGNMKNDAVVTEISIEKSTAFARENGFSENDMLLVFGSTRPGDEQLALACWQTLKDELPALRLIIVPRHLQRMEDVLQSLGAQTICKRTEISAENQNKDERILVVDTLGELTKFYAIATVAVIGGSFFPGVEGHNPLESASLGIPTVFGPYMGNFPDAAELLLQANGAFQIQKPEDLPNLLRKLLGDSLLREQTARKGREAVFQNRGAVAKNIEVLKRFLVEKTTLPRT